MRKSLFIVLLLFPFFGMAQNYVDLFKIGYGQTFNNDFEVPRSPDTHIDFLEADLTFPLVLNEKNALITGVLFSSNKVQIFPDNDLDIFRAGFDEDGFASLKSTTLKLGLATTYNDTWSSTIVLLPKIASDYVNISGNDFFFGGIALLKQKRSDHLTFRYGFYATTEAFGPFTTPIFGWYYLSPSGQFEMDMSLPIAADINYTQGVLTYGLDYIGIGRSFNINQDNSNVYIDMSSLDFAAYLQYNAFNKSVLLRGKLGYSTSDYEAYRKDEKIDIGVSAFGFGDNRTQLNPTINGGFFFKFEAVYRFSLSNDSSETK
ncbi:MAG: hypothetical protein AAFP76_01820 [Bacteroidota bacterium]